MRYATVSFADGAVGLPFANLGHRKHNGCVIAFLDCCLALPDVD
jgi:hypothetical protein